MKCSGMWVLAQSTPRWVFIHPVDSGLSRPKPQEHQSLQEAVMVSWDSTWESLRNYWLMLHDTGQMVEGLGAQRLHFSPSETQQPLAGSIGI